MTGPHLLRSNRTRLKRSEGGYSATAEAMTALGSDSGIPMVYLQGDYCLQKATVAVERSGHAARCFQVPEGAKLQIDGFHREGSLVEVLYAGRVLLMFAEDLAERAQLVEHLACFRKSGCRRAPEALAGADGLPDHAHS